jgi:hypothetical protein
MAVSSKLLLRTINDYKLVFINSYFISRIAFKPQEIYLHTDCFSKFLLLQSTSWEVSASADHSAAKHSIHINDQVHAMRCFLRVGKGVKVKLSL